MRWLAAALLVGALLALLFRPKVERELFYPMEYFELVERACGERGLEPALLMGLALTESSFDPRAVSPAGARGLTQIMPETFEWLQGKTGEALPLDALFEPEVSLRYGALLLRLLLDEFILPETALAAYHAGRGRVNQWLRDPAVSPDGRALARIPAPDTRHYVGKVMKAYNKYNEILSVHEGGSHVN
ncbi:MAG: lytic transglycosylase domain-containing protein [Oscillospiraceae bacterium]|jgi:soluble lytic murein transglycosylase|nr:lytic transglycosylase domain-containing protein [Oscillospiraceae bacterium]